MRVFFPIKVAGGKAVGAVGPSSRQRLRANGRVAPRHVYAHRSGKTGAGAGHVCVCVCARAGVCSCLCLKLLAAVFCAVAENGSTTGDKVRT